MAAKAIDRVGLGWRQELAAGIFSHLDQIDLIEIIADNHFHDSPRKWRALRTLGEQVPVTLHGVGLGLSTVSPVSMRHLEKIARLIERIRPQYWSEHLAFVRADGIEIGHLAAPPRTEQSVDATIRNIGTARHVVGTLPLLENIATLMKPPASTLDEASWISDIIHGAGAPLLLDLHNLYANAVNFGIDPASMLMRLPLCRVQAIHLSGGMWIAEPDNSSGRRRLLDDHVHDVPQIVFDLLSLVAEHAVQPLDVIIERDGCYPKFEDLLAQMERARSALLSGRSRAHQRHVA